MYLPHKVGPHPAHGTGYPCQQQHTAPPRNPTLDPYALWAAQTPRGASNGAGQGLLPPHPHGSHPAGVSLLASCVLLPLLKQCLPGLCSRSAG